MNAVVNIALPVFAVIAAGLAAGRLRLMNAEDSQTLNKFVFRFAMPAALFGLTSTTPPPGAGDAAFAFSYAVASLIAIFGGYRLALLLFPVEKQEAGAHAFASTVGNAVFLGLPIALTIETWARPYIVLMLIEGVMIITIGASLMAAREAKASIAKRIVKFARAPLGNPLVVASGSGFLFSAAGVAMPESIVSFLDILGRAAGPTALFSLGLFLGTNAYANVGAVAGRAFSIAAVKMALLPAVALTAAYMLGVNDPAQLSALALFTFMPSGVTSFVMASQYGFYKIETAAAISLTTLISIVTVSGVLVIFA